MTRNKVNEELCLISQVEPKSVDEACKDDLWIQETKEENFALVDHFLQ